METRDKVYRWFSGDLIPSGGQDSRIIVAGNMLHKDSLIMRLKSNIEGGKMTGLFRSYPLLDGSGTCLWPGKFPNEASIEAVRKKLGNYNSWMREYMLTILPEDDQLVPSEWIRYYDNIPSEDDASYRYTLASFDLAISQKDGADFTAGIIARVFGWRDTLRIYILPHPINKRLNFPEQLAAIKTLSAQYKRRIKILIEANGYQRALPEQLVAEGYPVEGVQNLGSDKRARLSLATPLLKNGNVLFPKEGADTLIRQLVGFGAEKHDDLVDAFSMLADYCVQHDEMSPLETLDFFFRLNPHLLTPGTDRLHKRF
jgi:predicted phage terminase large subunit-like protein